jgi:hypothetical protein
MNCLDCIKSHAKCVACTIKAWAHASCEVPTMKLAHTVLFTVCPQHMHTLDIQYVLS